MLFASTGFGKIAIVFLYIGVGSPVVELLGDGWPAGGGARRLFLDYTFVLVAIVMLCHCSGGMTCAGMPLYPPEVAITYMRSAWE
jgi:hypothetical protein